MRRTFLAVLGIAALAVAGCGDDDKDSKSADSKPLSQAEFIAKADAICVETKTATKKYQDQADALNSIDDIKKLGPILRAGTAEIKTGLDRLKALPAPTADKALLDAYYAARDKTIAIAPKIADAAEASDVPKAGKLSDDAKVLSEEQNRLAKAYGFKHCSGK